MQNGNKPVNSAYKCPRSVRPSGAAETQDQSLEGHFQKLGDTRVPYKRKGWGADQDEFTVKNEEAKLMGDRQHACRYTHTHTHIHHTCTHMHQNQHPQELEIAEQSERVYATQALND